MDRPSVDWTRLHRPVLTMLVNDADAGRTAVDPGVYADALGISHADVEKALSTLLAREMFEGGQTPSGNWAVTRIRPLARQLTSH